MTDEEKSAETVNEDVEERWQPDKATKIAQLREKLRRGRGIDEASTDTGGYGQGYGGTIRSGLQDARSRDSSTAGISAKPEGSNGQHSPDKRGLVRGAIRDRRAIGRSSQGGSGVADTTEGTESGRSAGRLITDEPIPLRQEDKPDFTFSEAVTLAKPPERYKEDYYKRNDFGRGVSYCLKTDKKERISVEDYAKLPTRKDAETLASPSASQGTSQEKASPKRPWFGKEGAVLSQKEAIELYEPLIAALLSDFEYLDKGIWLYCMSQDQQPIWSDMSRDEVEVLAKIMLKRGQHSKEAAAAVRAIVDSDIWIQVGAITLPRAYRTYQMLKGSPRPALQRERRKHRNEVRRGRLEHRT